MKTAVIAFLAIAPFAHAAAGRIWTVGGPAAEFPFITPALNAAADGDTIQVAPGVYREDLQLNRHVTLLGITIAGRRPLLIGTGLGTVITVRAPGCEIRGFDIEGSGTGLTGRIEAGIHLGSDGNIVAENHLRRVFYGIVVENASHNEITGNSIEGFSSLPFGKRGDGIFLYRAPDNLARGNRVSGMRDALYFQYAPRSQALENIITASRYGLHDMYSNGVELRGNEFSGCSVGANIMNCRQVTITHNRFVSNRGIGAIGLSFKECDSSTVEDNDFLDNARGLQVEGASLNRYTDNRFAYNDVAVQLFASAEKNVFTGNQFRDNLSPLLLAGSTSSNTWSENGRGNFWDGYRGYDFDGDGVGEEPMNLLGPFEKIESNNPAARLFLRSPAATALTLATPFDASHKDVTDAFPLVCPPGGAAPRPPWALLLLPATAAAIAGALLTRMRPC